MKCPECDLELIDDSPICPRCGLSLEMWNKHMKDVPEAFKEAGLKIIRHGEEPASPSPAAPPPRSPTPTPPPTPPSPPVPKESVLKITHGDAYFSEKPAPGPQPPVPTPQSRSAAPTVTRTVTPKTPPLSAPSKVEGPGIPEKKPAPSSTASPPRSSTPAEKAVPPPLSAPGKVEGPVPPAAKKPMPESGPVSRPSPAKDAVQAEPAPSSTISPTRSSTPVPEPEAPQPPEEEKKLRRALFWTVVIALAAALAGTALFILFHQPSRTHPALNTPNPAPTDFPTPGGNAATVTPVKTIAPLSVPAGNPPKAAAPVEKAQPRPEKSSPAFKWDEKYGSEEPEETPAQNPDHLQESPEGQESSALQTPPAEEVLPENADEETSPETAAPDPSSEESTTRSSTPEPATDASDGQEPAETPETPAPEENP
jgi:hypothetical protein